MAIFAVGLAVLAAYGELRWSMVPWALFAPVIGLWCIGGAAAIFSGNSSEMESRRRVRNAVRQRNAEIRRRAIESADGAIDMAAIGAKKLATDEFGTLWSMGNIDDDHRGPYTVVEVVNGTPEPDGTYKTYRLRVPPDMKTPREAIAALNLPPSMEMTRENVVRLYGLGAHDYVEVDRT